MSGPGKRKGGLSEKKVLELFDLKDDLTQMKSKDDLKDLLKMLKE